MDDSTNEGDGNAFSQAVTEKWSLGPLTDRVAKAQSFGAAIRTTGEPRTDTPTSVPIPVTAKAVGLAAAGPSETLNGHQKALIAFSEYLEKEIEEPVGKPARMAAMLAGPQSQAETAKSRVKSFLAQQKAKLS